MGGPPAPGVGFGAGIERLLLALEAQGGGALGAAGSVLDAFVVDGLGEGGGTTPVLVVAELREGGLAADRAYGGRSLKAQWKAADRSGARFGVMLGRDEAARGVVAVKELASGEQVEVRREDLVAWLRARRPEETEETHR
jgi:histidyl-tRNA synthetase